MLIPLLSDHRRQDSCHRQEALARARMKKNYFQLQRKPRVYILRFLRAAGIMSRGRRAGRTPRLRRHGRSLACNSQMLISKNAILDVAIMKRAEAVRPWAS